MDHVHILGTGPSSVILSQRVRVKKTTFCSCRKYLSRQIEIFNEISRVRIFEVVEYNQPSDQLKSEFVHALLYCLIYINIIQT